MAVGEWKKLANSTRSGKNPDGSLIVPDDYFTFAGLTPPSQRPAPYTGMADFGTNKYGYVGWGNNQKSQTSSGGPATYSGMWFDEELCDMYTDGGDSRWGETSVHKYSFNCDDPFWTPAVIKSSHKDNFRVPSTPQGQSPIVYPVAWPADCNRVNKMYDGTRRGGHTYHTQWFIRGMNALACFGSHQYFPVDMGSSPEVEVADLTNGWWVPAMQEGAGPIATIPIHTGDNLPWMAKHTMTEDVWMWRGDRLMVWRYATGLYDTVFVGYAGMRLSGAIDLASGNIFLAGQIGTAPHQYFTIELEAPYTHQTVTLDGPFASQLTPNRKGGLWFSSDLQQILYFKDDGHVHTVKPQTGNTYEVDRITTTGEVPPAGSMTAKAGGPLNNFQDCPPLGGMFCRMGDTKPSYFLATI